MEFPIMATENGVPSFQHPRGYLKKTEAGLHLCCYAAASFISYVSPTHRDFFLVYATMVVATAMRVIEEMIKNDRPPSPMVP
jgi:hypothetical protein